MNCYAVWVAEGLKADSWAKISEYAEAGTAAEHYSLGDTKDIQMVMSDGTTRNITVMIADFGVDQKQSDGKKAGITFVQVGTMPEEYELWKLYNMTEERDNYYSYLPEDLKSVIKPVWKKVVANNSFTSKALTLWGPGIANIHGTCDTNYEFNDTMFKVFEGLTASQKRNKLSWFGYNVASRTVKTQTISGGTVNRRSYFKNDSSLTEILGTSNNGDTKLRMAICFCV